MKLVWPWRHLQNVFTTTLTLPVTFQKTHWKIHFSHELSDTRFFPQLTSREKFITTVIAKFAASHNDTTVEINISLSIPTWPAPFENAYWNFTRQQIPKHTNFSLTSYNKRETNIMTWIINIITTFLLRHTVIQTNIPSAILTKNVNISTRNRPTEKLTFQEVLKRMLFSTSKHGKRNNVQTNRQKYKQDKDKTNDIF